MRIIMLDLDTLRPDHLSCYGYERDTSPTIDSICNEGVRFDNYYCSDAPCLPSRAALISGRFGIHNGAVGHGGSRAEMFNQGKERSFTNFLREDSMANIFRRAGYYTASISPFAERHSAFWFYAGFLEMHNTGKSGMESAEEITPVVLDWIDRNKEKEDWFLHVNYWDPHTPYRAPEEFGNPFKDDPLPSWITDEVLKEHMNYTGPHSPKDLAMYDDKTNPKYPRYPGKIEDRKGLRKFIDGYDCGVRYLDSHIEKIVEKLKEQGVYEETAIIITADHGENLGELGIYGEHGTADDKTCKIPMIIKWPGAKKGIIDKGLHYNFDFLPTACDLLGVWHSKNWDGISYESVITKNESASRDFLVLSQMAHVCQRSVRFENMLYMRTYHDGYHLFPKEMLFDLENDPHEENNIADENPQICQKAASMLLNWHDDMMTNMNGNKDPMETVLLEGGPLHAKGHLKEYVRRLKKTGREDSVKKLIKDHPSEFIETNDISEDIISE